MQAFIGFYWTYPVNWAGFQSLPSDVEAAAAQSRTIRYQRQRSRGWVADGAGQMVDEIAFMDTSPDRPTNAIHEGVSRIHPVCVAKDASLVIAEFGKWRYHHFLYRQLDDLGIRYVSLEPKSITIDGELFDPINHFRHWAFVSRSEIAALRTNAIDALRQARSEIGTEPGQFEKIATHLNELGVKTFTGKQWTGENVKKALRMTELAGES